MNSVFHFLSLNLDLPSSSFVFKTLFHWRISRIPHECKCLLWKFSISSHRIVFLPYLCHYFVSPMRILLRIFFAFISCYVSVFLFKIRPNRCIRMGQLAFIGDITQENVNSHLSPLKVNRPRFPLPSIDPVFSAPRTRSSSFSSPTNSC